ncbi:unnamed protein product [Allacma fusca]|uniref:RING-type E3 ubiquitin transferase n=1 Tax=Allacma fusca TaxID=39272 RepID=A0A8J2K2S2_9HEXA|nr:unnamed protein product [Allacma fusca]
MGNFLSFNRTSDEVEEADNIHHSNFRYPPKSGCYFGSHFIMGGERFETPQPEQYLFGENTDLNLLGSKPVPFPYPAPQSNEPTKTLKALINIRKESVKFVKVIPPPSDVADGSAPGDTKPITKYNVEFTFDSDCRCEITIMYFCTEEITSNGIIYRSRDPKLNSESLRFKSGANQQFTLCEHIFDPSQLPEMDLQFDSERECFPIVIYCQAIEGEEPRQSHTTIAGVDKHSDGSYVIKPLKQKLFVDGMAYLLQEIYGIENKNTSRKCIDEEDSDENAAECVICMSDVRDTLILPCRHLCLCHSCADSLRYQANNCPICRAPFRALLQIRAVYRIPPAPMDYPALPPDMPVIQMNAIPGYEMVPLLEALNGPFQASELSTAAAALARQEAARILNGSEDPTETSPIAMTVMVAPNPRGHIDLDSGVASDKITKDALMIVSEKNKIGSSIGNGIPSVRLPVKSPSDPEDDEDNFGEERDALPDLEDFSDPSSPIPGDRNITYRHVPTTEDEPLTLANIGSHPRSAMMIAAIDEFSDEEDHIPKKTSGLGFNSDNKNSDSTQSTPLRQLTEGSNCKDAGSRYSRSAYPSSLPTTPNCRISTAVTNNSTSTRSSGDSFTSSSSTKQLLPPSLSNHQA